MKRLPPVALACAAVLTLLVSGCSSETASSNATASATPFQANLKDDGLAGISGWQPPTAVCGTANLMPVIVKNTSPTAQTFSMTIGAGLTEQVIPMTDSGSYTEICPSRSGSGDYSGNKPEFSQQQTVQPGQTYAFFLSLGGVDYNLITAGSTFSIGGLPNGASGASWYDFDLQLNGDGGYNDLIPYYSNTGGPDTNNGQNGFAIVGCSPSSFPAPTGDSQPVTITPDTSDVLSPWSKNKTNAPTYGWWEPMCMAWLNG